MTKALSIELPWKDTYNAKTSEVWKHAKSSSTHARKKNKIMLRNI